MLFISGADPLAPGDLAASAAHSQVLAKPFTEHALLEALHGLLGGS